MSFLKVIVPMILFMAVSAHAQQEEIAQVETHGLVFKDKLLVRAFEDPSIQGVTCYITLQSRTLSFEDASDVALSCVQTGQIGGQLSNQADIFSQKKNPFFKVLRVDRFFDAKRKTLVYLAYTQSTGNKNNDHAMSVVVLR